MRDLKDWIKVRVALEGHLSIKLKLFKLVPVKATRMESSSTRIIKAICRRKEASMKMELSV